jgi:hypothetical protein
LKLENEIRFIRINRLLKKRVVGGIKLMKKPDVIKQVADVSGLTQGDVNKAIKALVKVI